MNGTIHFNDSLELAEFLKNFVGCTAVFTVSREGATGFVLTFTGGF